MIELMVTSGINRGYFSSSGPGNKTLLHGNANAGYFGEVTASELFTTNQIASFAKLKSGVDVESNPVWLKFIYKGKFLFISKKPVRTTISWDAIYNAGAAYGVDNNGSALGPQTTNQFSLATKDTTNFKVRILHGDSIDPSTLATGTTDADISRDSEWNQLMYRVSAGFSTLYPEVWASYSATDLGYNLQPTICIEHNNVATDNILTRGVVAADKTGLLVTNSATGGWRPVLELIHLNNMLLSVVNARSSAQGLMAADGISYSFVNSEGVTFVLRAENIVSTPSVLLSLGGFTTSSTNYVIRTENVLGIPSVLSSTGGITTTLTY